MYASTENYYGVNWDQTNGGQLWRSANGSTWSHLTLTGFDGSTNFEIFRLAAYENKLYASTWALTTSHGTEIWSTATGNSADWTKIEANGFGDTNNASVVSFATFGSYLYAGTFNGTTGGEVWRSTSGDGSTWSQVNTDGFGDVGNIVISALQSYGGSLYAATHHKIGTGMEVWRCQVCDGSDWAQVVTDGFGNPDARIMPGLEVSDDRLYLVIGNNITGMEVWRTTDGANWVQIASEGFNTLNNRSTYYGNALTVFGNSLYLGTNNGISGGEIWRLLNQSYLPLITR